MFLFTYNPLEVNSKPNLYENKNNKLGFINRSKTNQNNIDNITKEVEDIG